MSRKSGKSVRVRANGPGANIPPGSIYRRPEGSGESFKPYRSTPPIPIKGGFQLTESEGHPFQSLVHKRPVEDLGGPFKTERTNIVGSFTNNANVLFKGSDPSGSYEYSFRGPLWIGIPIGAGDHLVFPPSAMSSDIELDEAGANMVHECSPLNPVSELSTALGELLKDGLPALPGVRTWEQRALNLVRAGDEFLNIVFGWEPLISDIKEIAGAIQSGNEIIAQYVRDSGRVVRRKTQQPIEREVSDSYADFPIVVGDGSFTGFTAPTVKTRVRKETYRRRWFSGAFTYHIPDSLVENVYGAAPTAEKLLGSSLTPESLWELTPWSWAIDWFSNASEVFSNLTQFEQLGLIMRWGYVMEHSIVKRTYTPEGPMFNNSIIGRPPVVQPLVLETEVKVRRPANPFGFGLDWEGLSPLQLAIAAALGITRLR